MKIVYDEDVLHIVEGSGDDEYHVMCWHASDWVENPLMAFSMARAVELAMTDPDKLRGILDKSDELARRMLKSDSN